MRQGLLLGHAGARGDDSSYVFDFAREIIVAARLLFSFSISTMHADCSAVDQGRGTGRWDIDST